MLDETLVINGLDIGDAMARLRNNSRLYTRLMGRFLEGGELNALKASIESGECQTSAVAAHTLKGAAANLSAINIQRLAAELEQDLKASDSICERHVKLLKDTENQYAELKRECEPYLEG